MERSNDLARVPGAAGVRMALVVTVVTSATAGLLHGAAARSHQGDPALVWMFALCAIAQVGWAALVAARPTRALLATGIAVNAGAVVVWALSRTVGIGVVVSLAEPEAVGGQDLACALFAGMSVVAAASMLLRPEPRRVVTRAWTGAIAAFALLAAAPAFAAGHTHTHRDGHEHLELAGAAHEGASHGTTHTSTDQVHDDTSTDHLADHPAGAVDEHATHDEAGVPADAHAHDPVPAGSVAPHDHVVSTATDTHVHLPVGTTDPTVTDPHLHPTDPTAPPPSTDPIISLDDPRVTDAQRAVAQALIDTTTVGMARFPDVASVLAAGYVSILDGGVDGYEHFVKWSYLADAYELDPDHIESIVVKKSADGTKAVVSAMYILTLGKTMADVPPLAGELTTWHDHDNLCFQGTVLVALAVDGVCPVGVLVNTPPMLHVWMVPNPCGPFAGIDEHGVTCTTHDH